MIRSNSIADIRLSQILFDGESKDIDRSLCIFYSLRDDSIEETNPIKIFVGTVPEIETELHKYNPIQLPHMNATTADFDAWASAKDYFDDLLDETRRQCPECHSNQNVKRLVYGYSPKLSEDEAPGGCCIGPQRWVCVKCKIAYPPKRKH